MPRKRKPFIAIELEVFDDVPAMAQAAGMTENAFGWPLLKLWRRCWQQKVAAVDPLVVEGFLPNCIPVLVAFHFAERLPDGLIKLRGLDRYFRIKAAQSAAADRTNELNAQRALTAPGDEEGAEGGAQGGALSAPGEGPVSAGKIEDRRSKIDQKDLPLNVPKKAKTARQPSNWEALFATMQERRISHLEARQIHGEPEQLAPSLINTLLGKVDDQARGFAGGAYVGPAEDILPLWEAFLESNEWAGGLAPPWPLQAFASPNQLTKARKAYEALVRADREAGGGT